MKRLLIPVLIFVITTLSNLQAAEATASSSSCAQASADMGAASATTPAVSSSSSTSAATTVVMPAVSSASAASTQDGTAAMPAIAASSSSSLLSAAASSAAPMPTPTPALAAAPASAAAAKDVADTTAKLDLTKHEDRIKRAYQLVDAKSTTEALYTSDIYKKADEHKDYKALLILAEWDIYRHKIDQNDLNKWQDLCLLKNDAHMSSTISNAQTYGYSPISTNNTLTVFYKQDERLKQILRVYAQSVSNTVSAAAAAAKESSAQDRLAKAYELVDEKTPLAKAYELVGEKKSLEDLYKSDVYKEAVEAGDCRTLFVLAHWGLIDLPVHENKIPSFSRSFAEICKSKQDFVEKFQWDAKSIKSLDDEATIALFVYLQGNKQKLSEWIKGKEMSKLADHLAPAKATGRKSTKDRLKDQLKEKNKGGASKADAPKEDASVDQSKQPNKKSKKKKNKKPASATSSAAAAVPASASSAAKESTAAKKDSDADLKSREDRMKLAYQLIDAKASVKELYASPVYAQALEAKDNDVLYVLAVWGIFGLKRDKKRIPDYKKYFRIEFPNCDVLHECFFQHIAELRSKCTLDDYINLTNVVIAAFVYNNEGKPQVFNELCEIKKETHSVNDHGNANARTRLQQELERRRAAASASASKQDAQSNTTSKKSKKTTKGSAPTTSSDAAAPQPASHKADALAVVAAAQASVSNSASASAAMPAQELSAAKLDLNNPADRIQAAYQLVDAKTGNLHTSEVCLKAIACKDGKALSVLAVWDMFGIRLESPIEPSKHFGDIPTLAKAEGLTKLPPVSFKTMNDMVGKLHIVIAGFVHQDKRIKDECQVSPLCKRPSLSNNPPSTTSSASASPTDVSSAAACAAAQAPSSSAGRQDAQATTDRQVADEQPAQQAAPKEDLCGAAQASLSSNLLPQPTTSKKALKKLNKDRQRAEKEASDLRNAEEVKKKREELRAAIKRLKEERKIDLSDTEKDLYDIDLNLDASNVVTVKALEESIAGINQLSKKYRDDRAAEKKRQKALANPAAAASAVNKPTDILQSGAYTPTLTRKQRQKNAQDRQFQEKQKRQEERNAQRAAAQAQRDADLAAAKIEQEKAQKLREQQEHEKREREAREAEARNKAIEAVLAAQKADQQLVPVAANASNTSASAVTVPYSAADAASAVAKGAVADRPTGKPAVASSSNSSTKPASWAGKVGDSGSPLKNASAMAANSKSSSVSGAKIKPKIVIFQTYLQVSDDEVGKWFVLDKSCRAQRNLIKACYFGDLKGVESALKEGKTIDEKADINKAYSFDPVSKTPLKAALQGMIDNKIDDTVLKFLLAHKDIVVPNDILSTKMPAGVGYLAEHVTKDSSGNKIEKLGQRGQPNIKQDRDNRIIEEHEDQEALIKGAQELDLEAIKSAWSDGASLNAVHNKEQHYPALIQAIQTLIKQGKALRDDQEKEYEVLVVKCKKIISWLLNNGAELNGSAINAANKLARECGDLRISQYLGQWLGEGHRPLLVFVSRDAAYTDEVVAPAVQPAPTGATSSSVQGAGGSGSAITTTSAAAVAASTTLVAAPAVVSGSSASGKPTSYAAVAGGAGPAVTTASAAPATATNTSSSSPAAVTSSSSSSTKLTSWAAVAGASSSTSATAVAPTVIAPAISAPLPVAASSNSSGPAPTTATTPAVTVNAVATYVVPVVPVNPSAPAHIAEGSTSALTTAVVPTIASHQGASLPAGAAKSAAAASSSSSQSKSEAERPRAAQMGDEAKMAIIHSEYVQSSVDESGTKYWVHRSGAAQRQLLEACYNGEEQGVECALEARADVNSAFAFDPCFVCPLNAALDGILYNNSDPKVAYLLLANDDVVVSEEIIASIRSKEQEKALQKIEKGGRNLWNRLIDKQKSQGKKSVWQETRPSGIKQDQDSRKARTTEVQRQFIMAAKNLDLSAMQKAKDQGADVNMIYSKGIGAAYETALVEAIGSVTQQVARLQDLGRISPSGEEFTKAYALYQQSVSKCKEIIDWLLKEGAQVDGTAIIAANEIASEMHDVRIAQHLAEWLPQKHRPLLLFTEHDDGFDKEDAAQTVPVTASSSSVAPAPAPAMPASAAAQAVRAAGPALAARAGSGSSSSASAAASSQLKQQLKNVAPSGRTQTMRDQKSAVERDETKKAVQTKILSIYVQVTGPRMRKWYRLHKSGAAQRKFIEACYFGDLEGIKIALEEGADINKAFAFDPFANNALRAVVEGVFKRRQLFNDGLIDCDGNELFDRDKVIIEFLLSQKILISDELLAMKLPLHVVDLIKGGNNNERVARLGQATDPEVELDRDTHEVKNTVIQRRLASGIRELDLATIKDAFKSGADLNKVCAKTEYNISLAKAISIVVQAARNLKKKEITKEKYDELVKKCLTIVPWLIDKGAVVDGSAIIFANQLIREVNNARISNCLAQYLPEEHRPLYIGLTGDDSYAAEEEAYFAKRGLANPSVARPLAAKPVPVPAVATAPAPAPAMPASAAAQAARAASAASDTTTAAASTGGSTSSSTSSAAGAAATAGAMTRTPPPGFPSVKKQAWTDFDEDSNSSAQSSGAGNQPAVAPGTLAKTAPMGGSASSAAASPYSGSSDQRKLSDWVDAFGSKSGSKSDARARARPSRETRVDGEGWMRTMAREDRYVRLPIKPQSGGADSGSWRRAVGTAATADDDSSDAWGDRANSGSWQPASASSRAPARSSSAAALSSSVATTVQQLEDGWTDVVGTKKRANSAASSAQAGKAVRPQDDMQMLFKFAYAGKLDNMQQLIKDKKIDVCSCFLKNDNTTTLLVHALRGLRHRINGGKSTSTYIKCVNWLAGQGIDTAIKSRDEDAESLARECNIVLTSPSTVKGAIKTARLAPAKSASAGKKGKIEPASTVQSAAAAASSSSSSSSAASAVVIKKKAKAIAVPKAAATATVSTASKVSAAINRTNDEVALIEAAFKCDVKTIKSLVGQGVNINASHSYKQNGNTPLMAYIDGLVYSPEKAPKQELADGVNGDEWESFKGLETVRWMLQQGADVTKEVGKRTAESLAEEFAESAGNYAILRVIQHHIKKRAAVKVPVVTPTIVASSSASTTSSSGAVTSSTDSTQSVGVAPATAASTAAAIVSSTLAALASLPAAAVSALGVGGSGPSKK